MKPPRVIPIVGTSQAGRIGPPGAIGPSRFAAARVRWFWLVVAMLLVSFPLYSEEESQTGDEWRINFIPYYGGPDIDVRLRLGGLEQHVDERFLEESGVFKPNVIGLAFGAVRQDWGLIAQGETLDSDFEFNVPGEGLKQAELEYQRVTLAVLYQWYHRFSERSSVYVNPWLGIRYRHLSLRLVDTETNEEVSAADQVLESDGSHWVEPTVGLRGQWFVTPKWSISATGSVDGYLQDQVSWTTSTWLKHHVSKEFSFGFGYRYEQFDFDGGSGDSRWAADGTQQGFILGMELDFYVVPSQETGSWDHLMSITPPAERTADEAIPAGRIQADMQETPPTGEESWLGKSLDHTHDFLNQKLDTGVETVDAWMLEDDRPRMTRDKSRFFLAVDTRFIENAETGDEWEVKPSVDAKIDLPNLEHRLKLALSSTSVDEKPGIDPFDREEGFNLGLETDEWVLRKTKFRLGIRSSLAGYASVSWKPHWKRNALRIAPEARAYYRTDKGEGLVGSMAFSYAIQNRYRAAYLPSLEYGKGTDEELQWLQNLSFAYIFEGDDTDRHRALFTGLSVKGKWEEGPRSYRWTPIRYRAPLYKKWLYWELGPEILWREDQRWEPEPTIRLAVSSLFWGTSER